MPNNTEELHRAEPTMREFSAKVVAIHPDGSIELDRSAFYAQSGGQIGDRGRLDGIEIVDTIYSTDKSAVLHRAAPGLAIDLDVGRRVEGKIDWARRDAAMRLHTAQHLLVVAVYDLYGPVPLAGGGDINVDKARVDFAWTANDAPLDADAVADRLCQLIAEDLPVERAADAADPGKWWWTIPGFDPIPCGGTHVASTGEVGLVEVAQQRKGSKALRLTARLKP